MNCKQIKELLKTDYLDGEIDPKQKEIISSHLSTCRECEKLEKDLQAQRAIWQNSKKKEVPEHIWQNIREAIYEESLSDKKTDSRGILGYLRGLLTIPRPAFAMAGSFIAIIFVVFLARALIIKKQMFNNEAEKTTAAMYQLVSENGYLIYDLGTNVEEYFL